jgi:hypothetical protein
MELKKMTSDELIKEIVRILKASGRETQLKVLRAIMRYENIKGLGLKEALDQELGPENTKESP